MQPFDIHIHTHLIFGKKLSSKFIDAIKKYGDSVYIITGGGSVLRLGYFDTIKNLLEENGIKTFHFSGIEPNPQASTINKATKVIAESNVGMLLALGGGSVMDATKAIAALVYDKATDIWPYVTGEPLSGQFTGALPVICIPTTAATASEVTPFAVISNETVHGKSTLAYPFLRPVVSWLIPEFTVDVPLTTTRDGASDILSHVFENYILGGDSSPMADNYCEAIVKTVINALPLVTSNPQSLSHRSDLLWASNLALNGYQTAGRTPTPFVLHALEHAMSGFKTDLAHGRGLAVLYPSYFNWLYKKELYHDRFARLGRNLFSATGDDTTAANTFISEFNFWLKENGLYESMSKIGISSSAHNQIAQYAIHVYGRNGVIPAAGGITKNDIIEIFEGTEVQS
jgi:alcohol dehydrogenase YqhD (iron-dependent ADH family)